MESELHIVNTMYFPPIYDRSGGSFKIKNRDALMYTVKDLEKGTTEIRIIPNPTYTFYRSKSNKLTYPLIEIDRDKVEAITVPYVSRDYEFAKAIGKEEEYKRIKSRSYMELREWKRQNLVASPLLYGIDYDIEDQFKLNFYRDRPMTLPKFKKAYMDIEVDINNEEELVVEVANHQINCITYFDETAVKVHAFLLDNQPNNPRLQYIKNNTDLYIRETLSKKLINIEEYFPGADSSRWIDVRFYNTEESLLKDCFSTIHKYKPDFVGFWYMPFDIRYILNRMRRLNMDIYEVCCHPDVPKEFKRIKYTYDKNRNPNNLNKGKSSDDNQESEWMDWVDISGYTQYYDMRAVYSNIRKRYKEKEYSLEYICNKELGEGKTPLSKFDLNIRTAAYKNYDIFLEYALTDTLRLFQLERKTNDIDAWYVYSGHTRLSNCHHVSIVIRNELTSEVFIPNNKVSGNNVIYDTWGKITGALVAKPDLCRAECVKIGGKRTTVYMNSIDSDASSQYPSMTEAENISKSTIYYKGLTIYQIETVGGEEHYRIIGDGDDFHNMLQTRVTSIFTLGTKYFNLPTLGEMNKMLLAEVNKT